MDQAAGRLHAAVKIDRRKDGFHGVCQNGRTPAAAAGLLALAKLQIIAQMQALGHLVQALLAHQRCSDAGQIALRQVGILGKQIVRRHQAQHGVAQKLQPFIAADTAEAMLVGIGAVIQRGAQQLPVMKCIA